MLGDKMYPVMPQKFGTAIARVAQSKHSHLIVKRILIPKIAVYSVP